VAVINLRGTGGSGKTELVRRILARYGWQQGACHRAGRIEQFYRSGRSRPFGYRLQHPLGGRPLAVVGHYEVTSGGCDTIRVQDGGIAEIMRLAGELAADGHDVIIEGLRLSSEVERTTELARSHDLHILRLSTPLDQCVRNLVRRRRASRDALLTIKQNTAREHRSIEEACARLRHAANVEVLAFDDALARAEDLLGITEYRQVRVA